MRNELGVIEGEYLEITKEVSVSVIIKAYPQFFRRITPKCAELNKGYVIKGFSNLIADGWTIKSGDEIYTHLKCLLFEHRKEKDGVTLEDFCVVWGNYNNFNKNLTLVEYGKMFDLKQFEGLGMTIFLTDSGGNVSLINVADYYDFSDVSKVCGGIVVPI